MHKTKTFLWNVEPFEVLKKNILSKIIPFEKEEKLINI
jgi:chemotaxis methyl-accepting protein methylase